MPGVDISKSQNPTRVDELAARNSYSGADLGILQNLEFRLPR